MKAASSLDRLIDGVLRFGVLLGSIVAIVYLVRTLVGIVLDEGNWYWGGVLACATVPVLFAGARWLNTRSADAAIRTDPNA